MDVVVTNAAMRTIDTMIPRPATVAEKLIAEQSQCDDAVRRLRNVLRDDGKTSRKRDADYRNLCAEIASQFGEALSQCIIETASLQTKARRKFGSVSGTQHEDQTDETVPVWWATRRSLQQATPWQVANLKATWFSDDRVYDLCCAIGGDAMGFAKQSALFAVDRDPILVAMAKANLGLTNTKNEWIVKTQDVANLTLPNQASIHIDPDRRVNQTGTGDRRTVAADDFSPAWEQVTMLLDRAQSGIVKLAPATQLDWTPADLPTHRVWIALQGTVREQSLLVGHAVHTAGLPPGLRSAYRLSADGSWHRFVSATVDDVRLDTESSPKQWLIDPVSSIRAAGLTKAFALVHSLALVGDASGFLTASDDCLPDDVTNMASIGRIVWTGSASDRKLRRELRARGWFPETIKCRGVEQDPAVLFRRYRDCGDTPVTLWMGRAGKKVYAAVSESA